MGKHAVKLFSNGGISSEQMIEEGHSKATESIFQIKATLVSESQGSEYGVLIVMIQF